MSRTIVRPSAASPQGLGQDTGKNQHFRWGCFSGHRDLHMRRTVVAVSPVFTNFFQIQTRTCHLAIGKIAGNQQLSNHFKTHPPTTHTPNLAVRPTNSPHNFLFTTCIPASCRHPVQSLNLRLRSIPSSLPDEIDALGPPDRVLSVSMRECGGSFHQKMHAVVPVREDDDDDGTWMATTKKLRQDWEEEVRIGGSLQNVDLETDGVQHGWASPPAPSFMVRGLNYFQKKQKMPCSESLLRPLGVDWLRSNGRLDHILSHPENRVMQALSKASVESRKSSFVLAVNLQIPGKEPHSAVFYFVTDDPIVEGSLLYRFVHEDDAFRNSRFKLINRIVKGPWIVRTAAGNHAACLLGKALTCRYIKGRNYLEIDVDMGSSTVANAILHLALGYVTTVSVDMAFLIESQSDEELPEKLLGAVRMAQIEMESAAYFPLHPPSENEPAPTTIASQSSQYWRKFGKSLSKLGSHGSRNGRTIDDEQ